MSEPVVMSHVSASPLTMRGRAWWHWPIHAGIAATIALIPLWYRFPRPLPGITPFYVSHFTVFYPALWTIAWWLLARAPGYRVAIRDHRRYWIAALLFLILWGFASTTWAFMRATHPEVGWNTATQLAIAGLFALIVSCVKPPSSLLILPLTAGILWNSAITIAQVARQGAIGLSWLGEFPLSPTGSGMSILLAGDTRWLRPYGLLPHPNLLGGYFAIALLTSAGWLFVRRRGIFLLGVGLVGGGFWALLLTFSRGAWLGLFSGGLMALLLLLRDLRRTSHLRIRLFFVILLLAVLAVLFALQYWPLLSARAGIGLERVELRSIADRVVYAQLAERAIREYPILGVGIGNFPWRAAYYLTETQFDLRGDNAHQTYLQIWAELGTIGLGLFLSLVVSGSWLFIRQWRGGYLSANRTLLFCAFIALAIIGLVDHYPWTIFHFQLAWFTCLAGCASPVTGELARGTALDSRIPVGYNSRAHPA